MRLMVKKNILFGFLLLFCSTIFFGNVSASEEKSMKEIVDRGEEISYKDCSGCHDGTYRERFDYEVNPECFECHMPSHEIPGLVRDSEETENSKKIKQVNNQHNGGVAADDVEMVLIPSGVFIMGSNDRIPDEAPEHIVYVKSFLIDKYEVTNERYKKYVDITGHSVPTDWVKGKYIEKRKNHPVRYVNWFEAKEYCEWRGKRLPTEAEWEKAARGTDGRFFPWGDDLDIEKANMPISEIGDTTPVTKYENGRSPYGLYDMAGNVYEWVEEWYYLYPGSPAAKTEFNRFSGNRNKILKGGSWYDCLTYSCGFSAYTFNRAFLSPKVRNNSAGFRCVKSVI